MAHAYNFQDLMGQKIHRLTFLEFVDSTSGGNARWKVRCECGTEFIVIAANVKNGGTKSCGCYCAEKNRIEGMKRRKAK